MDSISLANASINTAPGLSIQSRYIASAFTNSMIIQFNENIETGQLYSLYIEGAQDCWLNSNNMFGTLLWLRLV